MKLTKSKNLDIYPYFFKYKTASSIDFNQLGEKLQVEPNRLKGMMRSIKHESTIYLALRQAGYREDEIPEYFLRPEKPVKRRRKPYTKLSEPSEKRSDAHQLTGQRAPPQPLVAYSTQEGTAQHLSALSTRSAHLTYKLPVQLVRKTPLDNIIDQFSNSMLNHILEEMSENKYAFNNKNRRQRQLTFDDLQTFTEALNKIRQIEMVNSYQMGFLMNLQPKPLGFTKEEIWEILNKIIQIIEQNTPKKQTYQTIHFPNNQIKNPNLNHKTDVDQSKEIQDARSHFKKDRKEAFTLVAKMMKESRENNYSRLLLEKQNKKINETIWTAFNNTFK